MKKFKFLSLILLLISAKEILSYNQIKLPFDNADGLEIMMAFCKKFLPNRPIILEAGAFDGKETVKMHKIWPDSITYAFEPVPEIYTWLKNNTHGIANIHCFPLALSDKNGLAEFHLSEEPNKPDVPSQSASLLPPKEHLKRSTTLFKKKIEVPTINIKTWAEIYNVNNIDLIWFDLQGFELNILKAMPDNLINTVKVIVTEVEFIEAYEGQYLYEDIKEWLENKGFILVARNFDLPPGYWFGDAIFVREKLLKAKAN